MNFLPIWLYSSFSLIFEWYVHFFIYFVQKPDFVQTPDTVSLLLLCPTCPTHQQILLVLPNIFSSQLLLTISTVTLSSKSPLSPTWIIEIHSWTSLHSLLPNSTSNYYAMWVRAEQWNYQNFPWISISFRVKPKALTKDF